MMMVPFVVAADAATARGFRQPNGNNNNNIPGTHRRTASVNALDHYEGV